VSDPHRSAAVFRRHRGTRFLPATASPKKCRRSSTSRSSSTRWRRPWRRRRLPVFITGSAIEDHFDSIDRGGPRTQGKKDLLDTLRGICRDALHLHPPAGTARLGHAVLCAHAVVGNEPFFVHLADDLIDAREPVLAQMSDRYQKRQRHRRAAGAAQPTGSYGIVATDDGLAELSRIRKMVEKPMAERRRTLWSSAATS
jgi:UTP--glucose-1-phosphate uridylyltransferase